MGYLKMDIEKPITVVNIPSLGFVGDPKNQGRTCIMNVFWEPQLMVVVVIIVGIPVEEALVDIFMNSRNLVVNLELYCDKACKCHYEKCAQSRVCTSRCSGPLGHIHKRMILKFI